MILKIAGNGGWCFKEKIKQVFVKPFSVKEYNAMQERVIYWQDSFLTRHQITGEVGVENNYSLKQTVPNPENSGQDISTVQVLFEDSHYETYLVDLAVYLMSDEGKTIERIN